MGGRAGDFALGGAARKVDTWSVVSLDLSRKLDLSPKFRWKTRGVEAGRSPARRLRRAQPAQLAVDVGGLALRAEGAEEGEGLPVRLRGFHVPPQRLVQLAQLGTILSLLKYNRTLEAEADAMGVRLLAEAGYDPTGMSETWQQLIAELDLSAKYRRKKRERDFSLFSTHPPIPVRIARLEALDAARGL